MAPKGEVKTVEESNYNGNDIGKIDFREASDDQLKEVADGIVSSKENVQQVKFFPEKWESLNHEEKENIAWQLTREIQDSIKELSSLWVEYSPDVTKEDGDKVAALEFVRENQEKIPQTWIKLEEKVNEVAKNIWIEINDKGIIDNEKVNEAPSDS